MISIEVSHSQLETFRSCKQKWAFRYVEGLRLRGSDAQPLRRGRIFHDAVAAAFDAWLKQPDANLHALILCAEISLRDQFESPDLVEGLDRDAMEWAVENAIRVIHEEATLAGEVPIAVEIPFIVPVIGSSGRKVRQTFIRGIVDLVMYNRKTRTIGVNEHKLSARALESFEKRLPFDPQISTYVDAARRMLEDGAFDAALWRLGVESKKGIHIGAVTYNVARYAYPKAPKTNKDGTISTAKIDTTKEAYVEALVGQKPPEWLTRYNGEAPRSAKAIIADERWIALMEKQNALADSLEGNERSYFRRFEHFRSDRELKDWRRDLERDAKRIRLATLRPEEITRNPANCSMPWSMSCEFSDVCLDRHDKGIRKALFTTPEEREQAMTVEAPDRAEEEDLGF